MSSHQRQRVRRHFSRTQPQTAQTSSRSPTTCWENFRQRSRVSNSSRICCSSLSLNIVTPPQAHSVNCNRETKGAAVRPHKADPAFLMSFSLFKSPRFRRFCQERLVCDRQSLGSDSHVAVGKQVAPKGLKWGNRFPCLLFPSVRFGSARVGVSLIRGGFTPPLGEVNSPLPGQTDTLLRFPIRASIVAPTAVRYNSSVP